MFSASSVYQSVFKEHMDIYHISVLHQNFYKKNMILAYFLIIFESDQHRFLGSQNLHNPDPTLGGSRERTQVVPVFIKIIAAENLLGQGVRKNIRVSKQRSFHFINYGMKPIFT
ncbi:hypothetical protein HanRHA438_Chr03g0102391 [Helianthus annuus]|nr:hypothetical protein HanIR_Chr12g0615601 [Helianthus annuus]KAJ0933992.1 hypothetical protein HanRHA438_Chr03g0102391 [Helianthus annuus]